MTIDQECLKLAEHFASGITEDSKQIRRLAEDFQRCADDFLEEANAAAQVRELERLLPEEPPC